MSNLAICDVRNKFLYNYWEHLVLQIANCKLYIKLCEGTNERLRGRNRPQIFRRCPQKAADSHNKTEAGCLSNMAARQEQWDHAFGFYPVTQNKARCFRDFLREILAKITGENLKAMKRFLRDVISLKIGVNCDSAGELVEELLSCHCLSEYDLDLLEDLLGVTGRNDILDLLREFKRKWPSVLESTSEKAIGELVAGKLS